MNILISNVYSWKNKGDSAIILSMLEHINREFPKASISISSVDQNDIGKYNENSFQLNFLTLVKKKYYHEGYSFLNRLKYALSCTFLRYKLKFFSFFAKQKIYPYWIFSNLIQEKIKSYQSFDFIIAAGGGYFISKGKKNKLESFFNHDEQVLFAYDFYLATLFNKPYMLYNQSIGPFYSKNDSKNLLPFLKKAKGIICREKLTYDRMENMGLNNIILSEDAAFNLKPIENDILNRYNITNNTNIGFTVRNCLPAQSQKKYEHEISIFLEGLLSSVKNIQIYFMPQVTYEDGGDNDLHVAKRIYKEINQDLQNRVILIDEDIHPQKLKYMYGEMDYFFGTRMHSCIFALASNVKTIALSYEPKTDGIMKSLKMDNYYINVKDIDAKKLLHLYRLIQEDKTYYAKLQTEVKRIQQESIINLQQIYHTEA